MYSFQEIKQYYFPKLLSISGLVEFIYLALVFNLEFVFLRVFMLMDSLIQKSVQNRHLGLNLRSAKSLSFNSLYVDELFLTIFCIAVWKI